MATSKHFSVQVSPRSDCEDFFNDTPYNSVTSFKSYQTSSCVTTIPSYSVSNQAGNVLNTTPYSNNPPLAGVIDNTVVSGYSRSKPPLPANKSSSRLAYNAKALHAVNKRHQLLNTKEDKQEEKFGIKQLQSISEKLREENSLHRRQRNPKQIDKTKTCQVEACLSDEANTDSGTSRSNSARRRLPNLPKRPLRSQSEKHLIYSSAENDDIGGKNEVDDILEILDSVLDEKHLQEWDSVAETQTEVVITESKEAHVKTLDKLTKHRMEQAYMDHKKQGSMDVLAGVSAETGDSEVNFEGLKTEEIYEEDNKISCANVVLEMSSHCMGDGSMNVLDSKSESDSVRKSTKLSKVDVWNSDNIDSEKDENLYDSVSNQNEFCETSQDYNAVPENLIESIKKNMELTEESEICPEETVDNMPANLFFTFDPNIIQELTDSVMDKKSDTGSNKVEQIGDCLPKRKNEINDDCNLVENMTTSPDEKVEFEGKTFNEKSRGSNIDRNSAKPNIAEKSANEGNDIESSENSYDGIINKASSKEAKLSVSKTKKVERSPSYRRKVMARAKSRYKKSSMLKDCSCTRNEKGEIMVCNFCATYESRKRSKSSLGLENMTISGENIVPNDLSSQTEISSPRRAFTPVLPPLPASNSPRPLRKVQVSSRVDLLMSSTLFKKHLHKHADLLERHTMLSRTGLRKSVSSLDISDGFGLESDSQCETESVTSEINYEHDTSASEDVDSRSQDFSSPISRNTRRHSLTGDSDSCIPVENVHKNKKKHFRTLPKSIGRSRPEIPLFTQPNIPLSPQRSNIPSFEEFKLLKEKLKATEDDNTSQKFTQTAITKSKGKKRSDTDVDEVTDDLVTIDSLPLQLQVIKESDSKENLVDGDTDNDTQNDLNERNSEIVKTQSEIGINVEQSFDESSSRTDISADGNSLSESVRLESKTLTRQNSEPVVSNVRQRAKPKLKSRTLSRHELENESLSDHASGVVQARTRKRTGAKRPRSLISKKSSLDDLILVNQDDKGHSDDAESVSEKFIKERPKLKVGHVVNRSKSDSRYEVDKGSKSDRNKSRPTSFIEKGKNSVTFDLEDRSQCSPFDIGESETSTSLAGSLSDSLRSEVNADDNFQLPDDQDDSGKLLRDTDDVDGEEVEYLMNSKDEMVSQVSRSTSDACEITQEAARKKRERKERPYKSDPFSGTDIIPASKRWALREEKAKLRQRMDFANSSKEEILTFLDKASSRELVDCESFPSLEELNEDDEPLQAYEDGMSETSRKIRKHLSNVSSLSTDSGVIGQDGSHDSQQSSPTNTLSHSHSEQTVPLWKHASNVRSISSSCTDLSSNENTDCYECGPDNVIDVIQQSVCQQCMSRRTERKKTIQEIFETEMNYGRDLNILKEEFYKPIMKAGLLNKDQLDAIFLNLDELIHVNKHFVSKLKSSVDSANHSDDHEMESVMIGCLFLESSTMFLTFENYCVNQAEGPVLLQQLEREKELLRIFLQVSQNDNHQLRRMHLKSFLMVPVQRIMKYPLLLDRLYKTTSRHHSDKNLLKEAKDKIEDILGHINAKSRTASIRPRKLSQKGQQHCSVTEKIEVSRVALDTLQWNRKDVCDVITSQLQVAQPIDHMWAVKKCKNYKFSTVYGVLLTLMQQTGERNNENDNHLKNAMNININNNNNENANPRVRSAAVVFIKEKNGRFQVMREPFMLEKCVVSQDPDYMDVFEILEWSKEAFLIKAETPRETKLWVQNLRQQMNSLGCWRKRRNALPNILLNHLS